MSSHRIVVIDSDEATTKYLKYEIKKSGFEAFTANNAKEGLISAFQHRAHVVVMDPNIEDMTVDDVLERLRKDRRGSRSKLIAFSSLTNPEEIQKVINMGFDHYIAKEGDAVPNLMDAIIESIKTLEEERQQKDSDVDTLEAEIDALDSLFEPTPAVTPETPTITSTTPPPPKGSGKTIVFLSAKGGTGTSSICANLAHMINEREQLKVVLVDMVLPIGSLATIVGDEGPLNIVEISAMPGSETTIEAIQESLPTPKNWSFQLLAGSPNPEKAQEINISRVPVLINTLRNGYDYIFIDLGQSLSRISIPIITSADQIVLILSPDEATVAQSCSVWEFLGSQGVKEDQVYPIINRAVGLEGLTKTEIEEEIGIRISQAIPYMERKFTLANNQHQPILSKFPDDVATFSFRQIIQEIQERISI